MNPNPNYSYQRFLERMHYFNNLIAHEAPQLIDTDESFISYYIKAKNQKLPAFDVTYNFTTEIMKIVCCKNNVRCSFFFPKKYLDLPMKKISVFDLVDHLIEFETEVNNNISIYFLEDLEWYFSLDNLHKYEDLLNIFLDIRYIALQLHFVDCE